MTESIWPGPVPPLRLRFRASEHEDGANEIIDLGWSLDKDDVDPWSIAFLDRTGVTSADSSWDVEDPTDPNNDRHPPADPAFLPEAEFVLCAASHWQRVHPRMRRFTQTELEAAAMLAGLGGIESALDMLVEARHGACSWVSEPHPAHLP